MLPLDQTREGESERTMNREVGEITGPGDEPIRLIPSSRRSGSMDRWERALTPKAVDCLIRSVVKRALIQKRVHPYVMRHTFATTLLDNGNDLKTVQALMGHSHIRTTETYLHSNDDRKVESIRTLQFEA